jgi:uncharacterized secreted protein with C-terminal beta-propeller domain
MKELISNRNRNLLILLMMGAVLLSGCIQPQPEVSTAQGQVKNFSSYEELKNFVKANQMVSSYSYYGGYGYGGAMPLSAVKSSVLTETTTSPAATTASADYSRTNIQVEGVDEADTVKTDGSYIYAVSGKKVVILAAYPARNATILSEIEVNGTPGEIFINKDKLVIFVSKSAYYGYSYGEASCLGCGGYYSRAFIDVYDVSNRSHPVRTRNVSLDGSYFDSRMIGNYVYAVINQPLYSYEDVPLPVVYSGSKAMQVQASEIYYFDIPDSSYRFTTMAAINTQDDGENLSTKVFLMGTTQTLYASMQNIYVVYTKTLSEFDIYNRIIDDVIIPIVPADVQNKIREVEKLNVSQYEKMRTIGEIFENYTESIGPEKAATLMIAAQEKITTLQAEIAKEIEKTVIHKISISGNKIEYSTSGEVPGEVLNQFSMDEYNGYFRIATTTGEVTRTAQTSTSKNHVYVLDKNLSIAGKLEDLAPGEKIYSARFMGDRAYLVTFRKVDPLFAIDLKDPSSPKVLGKLKIPGYSDYLHPYDENHIIGIGKETVAAEEGDFSWYQGVKLSLFDVSDVENPKEISKYSIGDRGTDSYALDDHKAFLFSKSKNLLVIPILLAKIDESKYPGGVPSYTYGDYVWQGAYVFNISLENGIRFRGGISHVDDGSEFMKSGYYYYSSSYSVKRSLYINDTLYTISDKKIEMNDLENLTSINRIVLPYESEGYYPYY